MHLRDWHVYACAWVCVCVCVYVCVRVHMVAHTHTHRRRVCAPRPALSETDHMRVCVLDVCVCMHSTWALCRLLARWCECAFFVLLSVERTDTEAEIEK